MTEAVFLPAVTLALWRVACALETPSGRNQVIAGGAVTLAIATRYQGLVLIPAVALAVLVMAWLRRDTRLVSRCAPLFATVGLGLLALYVARLLLYPGGSPLGAYGNTVGSGYRFGAALRWAIREAGDVFLLVLGIPLIAASSLVVAHLRDRKREAAVSALLAVTLTYALLAVSQVGAFASLHVHHLAERHLITLGPPLFVVFTVWLGRGMPRPQPATAIVAFIVSVPAILLPVGHLINDGTVPDAFMTVPLLDLAKRTSGQVLTDVWSITAALLVALAMLVPRRAAPILAALVIVGLVGASILAQPVIIDRTRFDRTEFFGKSSPRWIDQAANAPVAYLDNGDPLWNAAWHQAFWNERLQIFATLQVNPAGPKLGLGKVSPDPEGRLWRADGGRFRSRLIVVPTPITLRGRRLKQIKQGRDEFGLTLWKTYGEPTISTSTSGMLPHNRGLVNPVAMSVFACGSGRLDLTLYAKQGVPGLSQGTPGIFLSVDRLRPTQILVNPGYLWHIQVAAPPYADGHRRCIFHIVSNGVVSATKLAFRRGSWTRPVRPAFHVGGHPGPEVWVEQGRRVRTATRVAYCLNGHLVKLAPGIAQSDLLGRKATLAIYISGEGLTCHPPPDGYVQQGFATSAMHVPGGIYAYYSP